MNYRHIFHAGNFADLLKHAVLLEALAALARERGALTVIDTHAGAGRYELAGADARRTGEGVSGIGRLLADPGAPAVFAALISAVRRLNDGEPRFYPGSPLLTLGALRPGDAYIGCELRADDHAALSALLAGNRRARILREDGWAALDRLAPPAPVRLLALIDPPFEASDDHARAAASAARVLARNPKATVMIWTPIKDLTSFDDALIALEDAARGAPVLVAETRLRPLSDPMRLNGCAMVAINPTPGLDASARAAATWIAEALGESGGLGRATILGR
jgi:23S rRNA (adenine2030-N6)-methyltransferase